MSEGSSRLIMRSVVVVAMGIAGLLMPGRAAEAEVRMACTVSYCNDNCSIVNCVAAAECAPSGSCIWDPSCNDNEGGPLVTCDNLFS